jgi:CRP/FNR family transcriptional regulator, cyclic AMP receptor protein
VSKGVETLGRLPLFAELGAEDVSSLDARCLWRKVKAGDLVIEECARDNDVSFVVSGHARVLRGTNGREVILTDIRAGESFGELAAIDGRPRSARIVAITDSVVAQMSATVFRDAIHRYPSVCDHILAILSERIRALNERFSEQIHLDMRERLCAELLRLSRLSGQDRIVISPPPTHLEIALRIGTRREAVTKSLNALEREGVIARSRGAIALIAPERLRQIAAHAA